VASIGLPVVVVCVWSSTAARQLLIGPDLGVLEQVTT